MNELPGELATDAANIGMWSLNVDANIFWGNQKVLDIFCLPPGDITLQQFLDRVHPDDHSMINDEIRLALEDGESHSIEYRVCLPDGSRRWVNARGSLCKNSDNFSQKLIGVVIDTTERKASEEAGVRMLEFETLLFEISSSFARFIMAADVDRLIEDSLGKLLRYFGGDRSGLVKLDMASRTARITHIFCRDGIPPVPADINLLPMFPWGFDLVLREDFHFFSPDLAWREQFHCFSSLDELPPEAETDRRTYEATGVKSALRVPIKVEENIFYILAIQSLTRNISWPFEAMPRLRIVGEVFTNALYKKKAEEELKASYVEITRLKNKLEAEAHYLRSEVRAIHSHDAIIGQSEALRRVLAQAEQVAATNSTVLLSGETGTGKELIAQAIHKLSPRHDKLMVKVNCASLPATLIENELFGREKGAYTGALTSQIGRFELANGSTIFLDEISELSLELQAKLLRVLQERQFEKVGSIRTVTVDVRVIAATNRNLLEEVRAGRFREDLYYRLNVFPIVVPPLRERIEDVPALVWEFVREFNDKMGKRISRISQQDLSSLQTCSWPGNVRELRNVVEHGMIISSGEELIVRIPKSTNGSTFPKVSLEELERRYIEEVLKQTGWRLHGEGGAAEVLGLNRTTLYSRMKKLGIPIKREKVAGLL